MSCLPAHWQSNALGGVSHNYPMGSATNFIVSAVFTRISTACLPCDLASDSDLRTSLALPTVLPPTSTMISPDWKPCSAAEPSGSTAGTTTPLPPEPATSFAGASLRSEERPIFLLLTSTMISPHRKPCSAAEPSDTAAVTTTPLPPEPATSFAGAGL